MLAFGEHSLRLATKLQGKHESLSLRNISSSGFIHYDGKAIHTTTVREPFINFIQIMLHSVVHQDLFHQEYLLNYHTELSQLRDFSFHSSSYLTILLTVLLMPSLTLTLSKK